MALFDSHLGSAYLRLTQQQKDFVDAWLSTGTIAGALKIAKLERSMIPIAHAWFDNPTFKDALLERSNQLKTMLPDDLATSVDALRVLKELLFDEDKDIQLKACAIVLKTKNPKVSVTNINLKEALDEAMKRTSTFSLEEEVSVWKPDR